MEGKEAGWDKVIIGAPRPRTLSEPEYRLPSFARDVEPEMVINSKTVVKWRKRATAKDLNTGTKPTHLGSGLIGHSQKMTVAARATAEKKTLGQRS